MVKKIRNEILAILLVFVLFIHAIPNSVLTALAESIGDALTSEETVEQEYYPGNMVDIGNVGEGEIVSEIVENRTETTKEYLLSDGMIMVQQFIEAVHYYDNGEYKEIDNTLEEKEGEYSNKSNSFKVKFNKGQSKKHIVEIQEDEYSLTLEYNEKGNKTKKVKVKNEKAENKENNGNKKNTRPNKLKGTNGQITFENISDDINFSYEVKNNKLKNNIVIDEEKDDYTFIFELQSSNLTLEQNDDKSISAYNAAGKEKFNIPMPSMIDADGKESTALTFELKEEEGKIKLIIMPDKNYINEEAELPVTIKPEIHSVKDKIFSFNNVYENGKKVTCGEQVIIGKMNGEEKSDVYMNFTLPEVSPYYELVGASVNIGYDTDGMGLLDSKDLSYNVSVVESTEDLESITFENKPAKMQTLNGITRESQRSTQTDVYESKVINPNAIENNVMTLAIETTEETSEDSYVALAMSASTISTVLWCELVMGIEDSYSMESNSINGATTYVNHANGQLTATIDLVSINTLSSMPLAVSLVYNDSYQTFLDDNNMQSFYGKNFKLNFEQYIYAYENEYYYVDADGSISTFREIGEGTYYSDEKRLTYTTSDGKMFDDYGNTMKFSSGKLTEITSGDNPNEKISIAYNTSGAMIQINYQKELTQSNVITHSISFQYDVSNTNRLKSVKTNVNNAGVGMKKALYYESGYLSRIKNQTAYYDIYSTNEGVEDTYLYYENNTTSGAIKLLKDIFNNQNEGISFYRYADKKVEEISKMAGTSPSFATNNDVKINLEYNGYDTKISYYSNSINYENACVSFNNVNKVISQWRETADGHKSIQATNMWTDMNDADEKYTEETCAYEYKNSGSYVDLGKINASNDSYMGTISGANISVFDNEQDRANNKDNYRYALMFRVGTTDEDNITAEWLSLSVEILAGEDETKIKETVELAFGSDVYVVIPCGYYDSTTTFTITNYGNTAVRIWDVKYDVIDSVASTTTIDDNNIHTLKTVKSYSRSMDYSSASYDSKQRVTSEIVRTKQAYNVLMNTTYTYSTSTEYPLKNKLTQVKQQEEELVYDGLILTKNTSLIKTTSYTYTLSDDNSKFTQVITTKEGENETQMQTSSSVKVTSNGGVVTQIAEDGTETTALYSYANGDNRLTELRYVGSGTSGANYICERYAYNNFGQVVETEIYQTSSSTFDIANGTLIYSQTDTYDSNGVYIKSTYGNNEFTLEYNNQYGFLSAIKGKIGQTEQTMISYEYKEQQTDASAYGDNCVSKKTYANGWSENYEYSTSGGLKTTVTFAKNNVSQGLDKYVYNYNSKGVLTSQSVSNDLYSVLTYSYGNVNDNTKQSISIRGMANNVDYTNNFNEYNGQLRSTSIKVIYGCTTKMDEVIRYSYDDRGQLSNILNDGNNTQYSYNNLGQLTNRSVVVGDSANKTVNETYTYENQNGTLTGRLLSINDRTATYDNNGYVTKISYNDNDYFYTYDNLGRLTSENDGYTTTTYTYDNNNNIQKSGFVYTNGLLTKVNNKSIVYDALGNPTTYKGNTFTWVKGRYLASGTMNGKNFAYSYDGNGMRYKKVVNGQTTEYYYNGSQLIMEARSEDVRIYYYYGATGIEGMYYQHTNNSNEGYYYFDKNTLGDIVAIRNGVGNIVATYEYNAWGEVIVNGYMGTINPFRYRGYYYDTETGFYYLQTRYYDPTIMRFINADNYELTQGLTTGELNMYSYCANNPIMLTDPTGEWVLTALLITSFVVGAAISVVSQGITYGWENINYLQVGIDGLFAVASAAFTMTGVGVVGSIIAGSVMGMAQYTVDAGIFRDEFTWEGFALSGVLGGFGGAYTGAGAKHATNILNTVSDLYGTHLMSSTSKLVTNYATRDLISCFSSTFTGLLIGGVLKSNNVIIINGLTNVLMSRVS